MKKIYVSENIELFQNEEAEKLLNLNNDLIYFNSEEQGIHKVSKERWEIAQIYEKKTWMSNHSIEDDRNFEHFERFDNLNSLVDLKIESPEVIELGCGPFTNMRLFCDILKPKNITLLDSLINEYLNHSNCTYKLMTLKGYDVKVVPSSIESFVNDKKFDVVVMINVIEHCFDVDLIFQKIESILSDNGILVFSDVYFTEIEDLAHNTYDAGHPIKLHEKKLFEFLSHFKTIFEKKYHGLYSQEHRNDIYFIGRKI